MTERHVTCISKPHRENKHEHIAHIGNSAQHWSVTRDTAIREIDSRLCVYYTVDQATGKRCTFAVVREPGNLPYLRTHADGIWNVNLLALPECNGSCVVIG